VKDDNIPLKQGLEVESATIEDYMESWRVRIWEHGFIAMFCGKEAYSKTKAFKDTKFTDLVVRRVLYRYTFKFGLISLLVTHLLSMLLTSIVLRIGIL
jgi:hypothetical protein